MRSQAKITFEHEEKLAKPQNNKILRIENMEETSTLKFEAYDQTISPFRTS